MVRHALACLALVALVSGCYPTPEDALDGETAQLGPAARLGAAALEAPVALPEVERSFTVDLPGAGTFVPDDLANQDACAGTGACEPTDLITGRWVAPDPHMGLANCPSCVVEWIYEWSEGPDGPQTVLALAVRHTDTNVPTVDVVCQDRFLAVPYALDGYDGGRVRVRWEADGLGTCGWREGLVMDCVIQRQGNYQARLWDVKDAPEDADPADVEDDVSRDLGACDDPAFSNDSCAIAL